MMEVVVVVVVTMVVLVFELAVKVAIAEDDGIASNDAFLQLTFHLTSVELAPVLAHVEDAHGRSVEELEVARQAPRNVRLAAPGQPAETDCDLIHGDREDRQRDGVFDVVPNGCRRARRGLRYRIVGARVAHARRWGEVRLRVYRQRF